MIEAVEVKAIMSVGQLAIRLKKRLISHDSLIDRKSTRLNSSHSQISYAVFCLKKKSQPYDVAFVLRHLHSALAHHHLLTLMPLAAALSAGDPGAPLSPHSLVSAPESDEVTSHG